ncbi:MAG: SsrA-binding protein [Firmicutes bacterium]|nr:SsrA-binding protein [Bacillota bacterium]
MIFFAVYLKEYLGKVELGLARGKKLYDKREAMAKESLRRPKC